MRIAIAVSLALAAATAHATQIEVPAGGRVDLTIDAPGGGIVSWEVNGGHSQDLPIIIDAGGAGDTGYIGGSAVDRGTIDGLPRAYQTERWGLAGYQIQVAPGSYDVVLGFVETYSGVTKPGQRTFSATVEGRPLVTGMDVLAQGCGRNKIVTRTARNVAVSGDSIDIAFSGKAAMVSVIEVRAAGTAGPDVGTGGCDWGDSGAGGGTGGGGGGGGGNTGGPQCDASDIPAQARAAGLTRLAFCDDFSVNSVAAGGSSSERTIGGQKKWTTERASTFGGAPLDPPSAFRFNGDGTMTTKVVYGEYNWFMSSSQPRGGRMNGFSIVNQPRFYLEARWKLNMGSAGNRQPVIWSMDNCHLHKGNAGLNCPGTRYLEPDWIEYTSGGHYLHDWRLSPKSHAYCKSDRQNSMADNVWYTVGSLYTGDKISYFMNDERSAEMNASGCPAVRDIAKANLPILVGGKPGEEVSMDFVRVWTAQ